MNVKERFAEIPENFIIKALVLFVGTFGGGFLPQRICIVYLFCLFIAFRYIKINGNGQERTVFFEYAFNTRFLQKFAFFLGYVHDDIGAALLPLTVENLIFPVGCANPSAGRRAVEGTGYKLDRVGHHKRRIKPEAEMTDYAVSRTLALSFILFYKLERT